MARQRAKGIAFDTSGYNQAAERIAQTGAYKGQGKAALGEGIAKGLFTITGAIQNKRERKSREAEAAQNRAQQQSQFEARLALLQKQLQSDDARERRIAENEATRIGLAQQAAERAAQEHRTDTASASLLRLQGIRSPLQSALDSIQDRIARGELDPNDPAVLAGLQEARGKMGKIDEAIAQNAAVLGIDLSGEPKDMQGALITMIASTRSGTGLRKEHRAAIDNAKYARSNIDQLKVIAGDAAPEDREEVFWSAFRAMMESPTTQKTDNILARARTAADKSAARAAAVKGEQRDLEQTGKKDVTDLQVRISKQRQAIGKVNVELAKWRELEARNRMEMAALENPGAGISGEKIKPKPITPEEEETRRQFLMDAYGFDPDLQEFLDLVDEKEKQVGHKYGPKEIMEAYKAFTGAE